MDTIDNPKDIYNPTKGLRISENTYDDLCLKYGKTRVDREIDLEFESKELAYNSFMANLNKKTSEGNITEVGTSKVILEEALPRYTNAIQAFFNYANSGKCGKRHQIVSIIRELDVNKIAYIALKTIIGNSLTNVSMAKLSSIIGEEIEDELRFDKLFKILDKKEQGALISGLNKRIGQQFKRSFLLAKERYLKDNNRGDSWEKWDSAKRINVGLKLIDLFIESTGLGYITKLSCENGILYNFTLDSDVLNYIHHNDQELASLLYKNRPMVIPPRDWTTPFNGGYLINLKRPIPLVRLREQTVHELYDDLDMPNVYKAVNAIQATAWRINQRVLKVANEISQWKHIPEGLDMPPAEPAEPPVRPKEADTNPDVQKDWRRAMVHYYQADNKRKSKRYLINGNLMLANTYKEDSEIYFPHNLDFRGRVYPLTTLSPQGNDFIKSLIEFAHGVPLGDHGHTWLAFHGANCYGLDKAKFEDRISWVYENTEWIKGIAENPLENLEWCNVDSPWEFLAFCFEWKDYIEQGNSYESHLPVAFDGSCSGIQHFSAMLKDEVGGVAVNLVPDDKVHDIYGIVASKVTELVTKDSKEGTEDEYKADSEGNSYLSKGTKSLAQEWLKYGITRKVTKRPTMTLSYGAKKYGFTDQVLEDTVYPAMERNPLSFSKPQQAASYMASKIWDSLGEVVVKAREAMDWLQVASGLLATDKDINGNNIPTAWITPAGFYVRQKYPKLDSKKVKTMLSGEVQVRDLYTKDVATKKEGDSIQLRYYIEANGIDSRKQKQGIAPNFVHSMDASHLMLTVCACVDKGMDSFAMIHDSFGCPAGHGDMMFATVREVFVDTYKNHNVLQDLHDHIANSLSPNKLKDLPEIPKSGSLDLDVVKESVYAFS